MRHHRPGLDAGLNGGGIAAWPRADVRRGALTSGAADQLAALAARAAHAPSGHLHFIDGDRIRLYGVWGLSVPWDVADAPIRDSLADVVSTTGEALVINDLGTDDRFRPVPRSAGPGRTSDTRSARRTAR